MDRSGSERSSEAVECKGKESGIVVLSLLFLLFFSFCFNSACLSADSIKLHGVTNWTVGPLDRVLAAHSLRWRLSKSMTMG